MTFSDLPEEMLPVPVVDMSASEAEAAEIVKEACLTTGFFYVKNHSIGETLLEQQFEMSKKFFSLPTEEKMKIKVNKFYRGWTPMMDEKLDPEKQTMPDTKEGMYIGREIPEDSKESELPLHGPNNWPADGVVPGFKETMTEYWDSCRRCTLRLIRLIALALELPPTFFDEAFTRPIMSLRPLHYAPHKSAPDQGVFAAGAHTDYGIITILATDDAPGLQILMNDRWVDVPPREGHLIINLGDMLHRWTNGKFRSALHRVVTLTGRERYSTAFFAEPNFEAEVAPLPTCISAEHPPKWEPTTSGAYLLSRYQATHSTYAERQKPSSGGAIAVN